MAEAKGWGDWYPTPELRFVTRTSDPAEILETLVERQWRVLQQKWCRLRNKQMDPNYDEEWRDVPHE